MIFGSFDFLHAGHFRFINFAKKYGDELVAVIARDLNIEKIKGFKPFHKENDRKKMLEQIKGVSKVYLGDLKDMYKVVAKVKPDVIVLGYDQETFVDGLKKYLKLKKITTKIIRAGSYQKNIYKSSKIKRYLSTFV